MHRQAKEPHINTTANEVVVVAGGGTSGHQAAFLGVQLSRKGEVVARLVPAVAALGAEEGRGGEGATPRTTVAAPPSRPAGKPF